MSRSERLAQADQLVCVSEDWTDVANPPALSPLSSHLLLLLCSCCCCWAVSLVLCCILFRKRRGNERERESERESESERRNAKKEGRSKERKIDRSIESLWEKELLLALMPLAALTATAANRHTDTTAKGQEAREKDALTLSGQTGHKTPFPLSSLPYTCTSRRP